MTVRIEFIKSKKELTLPIIKLTKSRKGRTGTATFIFVNPSLFQLKEFKMNTIMGMYLLWENKQIKTKYHC